MIRTIIWFIWFFLSLIISTPFLLRVKYLSKKGRVEESNNLTNKCARIWANSLLKIAGVKVNVHGLENLPKDRTVLYVGNHQGNFDIPIYLTSIPNLIGFISKIEVQKIPLVTGWMNALHCVFMDRSNVRKSGEAIIKGIRNLKAGFSIVIFPEGTRSKGDKMAEFKAGSFKLATKAKCPIVPITMNGSYKIMEHGNGPWIKKATVDFYIHKMVETDGLSKEELDFGYRSSAVMKKGYIVLSAILSLKHGEVKTIKEMIADLTEKRESKQPLEYPSAGSTFKRPEGYFAGKLIQDAGLKGYEMNGAAVSSKHSGFVINKGGASAKDILNLIKHIQDEVKKQFGVELHTEVRIVGEDENN